MAIRRCRSWRGPTGEQKVEDDGQIQKGNMRQIFQKFPVLFLLDQPETT